MTSANERFDLKMKYHKQNEQFKLAGLPVKDEYWLNLQVERELEIKKANRLREKKLVPEVLTHRGLRGYCCGSWIR